MIVVSKLSIRKYVWTNIFCVSVIKVYLVILCSCTDVFRVYFYKMTKMFKKYSKFCKICEINLVMFECAPYEACEMISQNNFWRIYAKHLLMSNFVFCETSLYIKKWQQFHSISKSTYFLAFSISCSWRTWPKVLTKLFFQSRL